MKLPSLRSILPVLALTLGFTLVSSSSAQSMRRGGYGDWNVKMSLGDREFDSILSFGRDAEGNRNGWWITAWGMTELKEVSFEDNQLSFTQTFRMRDEERTSRFKGTIEDGKLAGILSGEQGETEVTGERAPRTSRAAGDWVMTIKAGEREYKGNLILKWGADGELAGTWRSQRGEHAISNLEYSRGQLSFDRTLKMQDNEWTSSFTGTLRGNTLTGVSTSQWGEAETTGERLGGEVIGTWMLALESERGPRQQRLRVNPDLSALYGTTAIEKVTLEGNQISFQATRQFGDRQFETSFSGEVSENTLSGEVTTARGTTKVTGTKVARRGPRNR